MTPEKKPLETAVEDLEAAIAETSIELAANAALIEEIDELIDGCPYKGLGDE